MANEHTPPTEAELALWDRGGTLDTRIALRRAVAEVRRLRAERSADSVDAARWRTIRPALGVDGDNATGEAYPLPDTVQWITFDDESLPSLHGCDNTVETIIDAARQEPTP